MQRGLSQHARIHHTKPRDALLRPSAAGDSNAAGTSSTSTTSAPVDPARAALLERIAKAKQYKQGGAAAATPPATPEPAPPPPPRPAGPVDWGAVASFIDSGGKADTGIDAPLAGAATPKTDKEIQAEKEAEDKRMKRFEQAKDKMSDDLSQYDTDNKEYINMIMSARQAPGRGSAAQPAAFLQGVLSLEADSDLDSNMRMEEFTAAKERKIRQMGAEILTVDATYKAGSGSSEDGEEGGEIVSVARNADAAKLLGLQLPTEQPATEQTAEGQQGGGATGSGEGEIEYYTPSVSTWGVFPRPKDMSKAYGGGRNIAPGQDYETKEQKAKREASYAAALAAYKTKAGLEVDVEAEAQASVLYDEGLAFFKQAQLQPAYDKFQEVLKLVPIKSKIGGMAGIQAAVILDSRGYSEEAQKLYKQLQGHAVTAVSRKAKQMLFGFQAAKFLKADTISYAARKGDFDRYFRPGVDRNQLWVPSEEERLADEEAARQAAVIAVAIIVGPIAFMAALIHRAAELQVTLGTIS